ncbi:amidohydrolase [Halioglobus maricola]|uniref:Amidohydrolase n=2 Tax=Halioglobus maricola TaxID=2601894 RepID=A0A5P9NPJ8_9GAMM|nr:amidohydrolase [Halioglobus maricola]
MYRLFLQISLLSVFAVASASASAELIVYTAKKIITMETALPEANAVAVKDGRIFAVGSEKELESLAEKLGGRVDRSLSDKILLPGFIDPHVHPSLPAVLTQFPFLAPDDWSLPTGEFPGATDPASYEKQLKALAARHSDDATPFIAWGYHPLWHGDVYREQLNDWFGDQPVMLWHRSFHELIGNDAALAMLGVTEDDVAGQAEIDWARGHFWENGLKFLIPRLSFLFAPERYGKGMQNFIEMMHRGGVTTALDMGTGIFGNPTAEIDLIRRSAEGISAPGRIILTPIITDFLARGKSPQEALAEIEAWRASDSRRVSVGKHFKIMMDGAIFSGLAQMGPPGYLDGHEGLWMAPLETTAQWAQFFWSEGYQIHAHTNGDLSAAALIDMVRTMQEVHPRPDHRTSLEHFAYSTDDQSRQMAALGMVVSANPYYQYLLADIYADEWLGPDRGRQMVRLGSLQRHGVPFGLHSDCPMAPLSPLTLAAAAVQRESISGKDNATPERIDLHSALRAITIDAAWVMGAEDDIGSIRAGKRADFTVLESDPYRVKAERLKDIDIWGVVFEGELHPVE